MGYLVIYDLDGLKTAKFFDTHDDAVDFINECSAVGDKIIEELTSTGQDSFSMKMSNGQIFYITIENIDKDKVKYDIDYFRNGIKKETRRFNSKKYAINYAHKVIDELGYSADLGEDENGEWIIDKEDCEIVIKLSMVIVEKRTMGDYRVLGLDDDADIEDVKHAFLKLAVKYHPDKGGDPEKFQIIHEAYQRIMDGTAKKQGSGKVINEYSCVDMLEILRNKDRFKAISIENNPIILGEIRSKASGLMGRGILEAFIGGVLTAISYNAAPAGGRYVIFTGLILVGVWNFLKGCYYYANPKSLIRKVLRG